MKEIELNNIENSSEESSEQVKKMKLITLKDLKSFTISISVVVVIFVIGFFGYVLYMNKLPLGLNKTETLSFGSDNDSLGDFKLLPSGSWGNREIDKDGRTYRTLNGSAEIVYQPTYLLTSTELTVNIDGENIGFYTTETDINYDEIQWEKKWDLRKRIPAELVGSAYIFDGCTYFDGTAIMYLDQSKDAYEMGPFSVYTEWMPIANLDYQEIVGHFNWEIFQSKNFVVFQMGRMNNSISTFYSIKAPIDSTFFNKKHNILVQYYPDSDNGYIEMFLDGHFIERKNIGSATLDALYGDNNLTMGWSSHNYQNNPHFEGCIYNIGYIGELIVKPVTEIKYISNEPEAKFHLVGSGKVYSAEIKAVKE